MKKKWEVRRPGRRLGNVGSAYLYVTPYALLFLLFIVIPVGVAVALSFTNFNAVQMPGFVGLRNYVSLLTQDAVFMQYVLPNTVLFAVIVGPGGYLLSFLLAWCLSQISRLPRTILALLI